MPIICIEKVIVAVADLDAARARWSQAGFAIASERAREVARLHAGAIAIELRETKDHQAGIIGWTWGIDDASSNGDFEQFLPGLMTNRVAIDSDLAARRAHLETLCGANENTVDYLEHIVVMTPSLEDAIAAHEKIGLPCKRIREAGGGMRQAFFKLEQTVLEIVGPGRGEPGVWGLAFMCKDIRRAVDLARANGLEATEPKTAIQGGKIARIVAPLDGVAIAYMES